MAGLETTLSPQLQVAQRSVQLLELGAHFALAERAAKIGYWRHQLNENHPHWSPGFYAMLGLDPGAVPPRSEYLMERIHPEDRVGVALAVAKAMNEGAPFSYRTRSWLTDAERAAGRTDAERFFDTHGEVERDPSGKIVAVLGVVREVTAEVAAEKKLRDSEAAYRFIAEEATDLVIHHGAGGAPVFVSPAVEQVLGVTVEECLGAPPFRLCHPADLSQVMIAVEDAKRSGKTTTYSYRAQHKRGHYVWLESSVRFVNDPRSGEPTGAISISRDITERKRFENELLLARERAESASHTKSRFLANMSHELRTPLNAIIGFSDILSQEMFGPLGNERYGEYAKLINESGAMLLDLINDLLDMSKIEAGKFELHPEEFLVREAVAAGVRLVSGRADEKHISVGVRVEPETLTLRADQRAFKQIMLNLLSNAIKFTNNGGTIGVEATIDGGCFKLVIRDSGIGIADDVLPRLARPFEQASSDPARAHGGSGLGLALVKSLAELHGGALSIASKEGHGTEVTVTLPVSAADVRAA